MPTKLAAVSGILAGSRPFSVWRRWENVGEERMVRFPEKKKAPQVWGACTRKECIAFARNVTGQRNVQSVSLTYPSYASLIFG